MSLSQFFRRCIIFLFHALLFTTPFIFTWVNEELFEFPKMLLVYGFTILITALWLGRMIIEKKWLIHRSKLDWPILAFLGSQILATIFSIHPRTSLFGYYTRFHGGLFSTISYVLLYYAFVSNVTTKKIGSFLMTLMVSGVVAAAYAFPEHFGHSFSCSLISNKFNVSCWVQDVKTRVFGTFGQPNWLAAYLITLLPLGITLAATTQHWGKRLLFGGVVLMFFLVLLFTRSRSGFAGFALSIAVLGAGYLWLLVQEHGWRFQRWFDTQTWLLTGIVACLVVVTLLIGSPFTKAIVEYLPHTPSQTATAAAQAAAAPVDRLEEGGTDSGDIRKIVWSGAFKVWQRYPLFGSGVETFGYSYYQDRPVEHNLVSEWDFLYNKAHNEFLNFLATTGFVGFTAYVVMLGAFAWIAIMNIMQPVTKTKLTHLDQKIVLSLLAGVAALTVSNFFGFSTVMVTVLLFLFFAILMVIVDDPQPPTTLPRPVTVGQYFGLGVVGVIALVLLSKDVVMWQADRDYAQGKAYIDAGYVQGVKSLEDAAKLMPDEALYHDELSSTYAKLAVVYAQQKQASQAAQIARTALQESKTTLALNSRHLNFYKTRIRVLLLLAQLEPSLYNDAKSAIDAAIELAPTDAKLWYNRAIILLSLGKNDEAISTLEKTVSMKANYEMARMELAKQYEKLGRTQDALAQYQYIQTYITKDNATANQKIKELSGNAHE